MKVRRRGRRNTGRLSVTIIVLALLVAMSIQVYRLKERDKELAQKEAAAVEALEKETQRADDIAELEDHMQSESFIVEMAHKLGLVFDDEIIFKESGDK